MIIRKTLGAFTLIELLINIAIISILAMASMAMFVVPMKEQVFSDIRLEQQAGVDRLLTQLTHDAHQATRVELGEFSTIFTSWNERPVVYSFSAGTVTRSANGMTGNLMTGVTTFVAVPSTDGKTITVNIAVMNERLQRMLSVNRSQTFNVGIPQ